MEHDWSREFLKVVEESAIAAARTMGIGDRKYSDQAAVEVMRRIMDTLPMDGTIVIGEGERDEAPMLYIGEKVGCTKLDGVRCPEVDIAVDPLEGTNAVPLGLQVPSLCWRVRRRAAYCMPRTATWRSSSWVRHRRAQSICWFQ